MRCLPCVSGRFEMSAELRIIRRSKSAKRGRGPTRDQPATVHPMPHLLLGPLDHALVEEVMNGMHKADRARFWRDHVDILGEAFAERGMAREIIEAILSDQLIRVREIHKARERTAKARSKYAISFEEPPEVGTQITVQGRRAVLVKVEPIIRRKDGGASWLLHWDIDGRRATSGLRSASVIWQQESGNAEG